MAVAFKELGGSPREEYNLEGFVARRVFLVAWDDREQFAVEVMGLAAKHGAKSATHYPGKPAVVATRVRFEPFDPDRPDAQELASLAQGLNRYSESFARATVDYETVTPCDREDGPENEPGTQLSYRMAFAEELVPVSAKGWHWADDPAIGLPDEPPLLKRVPVTEHHLTWYQVIYPPWTAIRRRQGTLNAAEFLGCAPGTLLFEGAEANKLFRAGLEEGASEFCWQIHYLFRELSLNHGGQVYGWNHAWREEPPGWAEPAHGTDRLYDLADFTPLFQSAMP